MSRIQISLWNLKNWLRNTNLFPPQLAAIVMLILGIVIAVLGFRFQNPEQELTFFNLIPDFYSNISSGLIEIAIAVLIIDALNRRREDHLDQVRLLRDIGCGDNGIALRAIIEITENKLHWKGFLINRHFMRANLAYADLLSSDLTYSSFHYSNFSNADLSYSKLLHTSFWGANMRGANLTNAETSDIDFIFADLTNARVTKLQLQQSYRLQGASLPNGKIYDGEFNLTGDIESAKAMGIDINDPTAMKGFYAMTHEEFMGSVSNRENAPEYSDWI